MATLRRSLSLAPIALLLAMPGALAQSWQIEDGSRIGFTAFQQGSPVEGRFESFTAEISFDPDDLADSRVEVEIDAASITTGHKDRDTTLRSSGFFDVATWPTATWRRFRSPFRRSARRRRCRPPAGFGSRPRSWPSCPPAARPGIA